MEPNHKGQEPMSSSLDPLRRKVGFRWDGVVTLGNVMTMIGMLASLLTLGIGLIIWGVRLEGRADKLAERQIQFEQEMRREQERDAGAFRDLKSTIEGQGRDTRLALDQIMRHLLDRK